MWARRPGSGASPPGDGTEPGPRPEPRAVATRSWAPALGLAAIIVVVFAQVGLFVSDYPQLSPVDELQHADYMIKAAHGRLLRRGDTIGPEAVREAACRGIVDARRTVPDCRTSAERPQWLQEQTGVNSEEIQPPFYYLVTGALARVGRKALGLGSIVTAGRLVGGLWVAAGAAALWALLGRFPVEPITRWGVTALVALSPQMLGVGAVLNNDVTALVAGAGVLLAAVAWEQRAVPAAVVLATVVAAIAFKPTNVVGVGVAAGYLLLRATDPDRKPAMVRIGAAMAGAAVASGLALLVLHDVIAVAGPLANPNTAFYRTAHLGIMRVVKRLPAGVTPIRDPFLPPFLATGAVRAVIRISNVLLLGSAVALIVTAARRSREWSLAVSALAACALAGPGYVVLNYVASHIYFNIPPRYALSALPGLAVALALAARRPVMGRALAAFAGLGSVVVLGALVRA